MQILLYFVLVLLLIFGLPGSIIGWMSMTCAGYLMGARNKGAYSNMLVELKPFIVCSIVLCSWVMLKNYQNAFDFDLLSDYFAKSSINSIPILMVCTCNLVCAIYFYGKYKTGNDASVKVKKIPALVVILLLTSALSILAFDFRSGVGLFLLIALVIFEFLSFRAALVVFFCLIGILLWQIDFNTLLIDFLAPGRDDVASVAEEVSDGSLRYERLIQFWQTASFSKSNFASWSGMFSFSGMSDFVAALFPISLLFFIPCIGFVRLLRKIRSHNWLIIMIVIFSAFSSFLISVLQPDFYSLFTFFSIASIVYFGEKKGQNTAPSSVSDLNLST